MTQTEIQSLLTPIEKRYEEVREKLKLLKRERFRDEQTYERYKENLMGQILAYQDAVSTLLSAKLNLAFEELNVSHVSHSQTFSS
jgi:hypothetical protein